MSDEKQTKSEDTPIKDEQLDKVSGGIMFPKNPITRTPHSPPEHGRPEPC
jgi:hypothetical protein